MPAKKSVAKKKVKKAASRAVKKKAGKPKAKKKAVTAVEAEALPAKAKEEIAQESEQKAEEEPNENSLLIVRVALVVFFLMALVFLAYQFNKTAETRSLEQRCLDIQNDPMLNYPCVCKPTTVPDEDDVVYSKTTSMCSCECEIEGVGKRIFEIRAAK